MNKIEKRVIIIGGGTFQPIRNHLSLAAPAFGYTAKSIHKLIKGSELYLTKMADWTSKLVTNEDVESFILELVKDRHVGTIILNVALCDFKAEPIDGLDNGWHAKRLETANGNVTLTLTPTDKLISKIRRVRPDIFLVGFKTTTNKSVDEQFLSGLKMMKSSKCNLVLANDTVTRMNLIITPEETMYSVTEKRANAISDLCEMITLRNDLTYHNGIFKPTSLTKNIPFQDAPKSFQEVVKFLIDNGGYIENNGNGFTPGHFCYRNYNHKLAGVGSFVSSQRKVNHNLVEDNGMTLVKVDANEDFEYIGTRKPSVGARSQFIMLQENPNTMAIVHTHNPLKMGSKVPIAEQRPFQCGSLECGMNTVNNLGTFDDGIKAVYLRKHGINILFDFDTPSKKVIQFIKDNVELGVKVR